MNSGTDQEAGAKSGLERNWRGPVLVSALRIVFLSAIAGGILTLFGVRFIDLAVFVLRLGRTVNDLGFAALGAAVKMTLLGAVIVVPLYALRSLVRWLIQTKFQR